MLNAMLYKRPIPNRKRQSRRSGATMGKGSGRRPCDEAKVAENWDLIFGKAESYELSCEACCCSDSEDNPVVPRTE